MLTKEQFVQSPMGQNLHEQLAFQTYNHNVLDTMKFVEQVYLNSK